MRPRVLAHHPEPKPNCDPGDVDGNQNFNYYRYTDDWAAQNYDMNYNIYVESPGNTRHETGSQWSCQQDPGYWWKCVSSVYGHSHPSSFKTAYNYPRLVFEGNTSGAGDAFAEWEWGNGGTSQQGAACSIY